MERPRAWRSIRLRVVVGYVVLLALALTTSALIVRHVLLDRLDDDIQLQLEQEAAELRRLAGGIDPSTGVVFGDDAESILDYFLRRSIPFRNEAFFSLVGGVPEQYSPADVPAQLLERPDLVTRWGELTEPLRLDVSTDAGPARTLAVPLVAEGENRGTLVIAWFTDEQTEEVDRTIGALAAVGLAAVIGTSLLAWWMAGRVLRPVRELTATAEQIEHTDLTARIPVQGGDELSRLGETFNAMLDRLEASFTSNRVFLDDVAHELRTPITILRGHLELLHGEPDPMERSRTVELVTGELDRMTRYVDDLLVLAKAEQPDFLHPAPVDIGELVLDLLPRVEALGPRRWGLDELPEPGDAMVLADRDRLAQAVLALATNAVQHTDDGDVVALGVSTEGDGWRLWVRDTGPGVDPSVRHHLFERATRAPGSRRQRPEGTGLGLAIVAAIAHAHGGEVHVEDPDDGGARFVVNLPGAANLVPEHTDGPLGHHVAGPAGEESTCPAS